MSSDLSQPIDDAPAGGAAPWVARHRAVLAYAMLAFGLASLGGAIYGISKGLSSPPAAAAKEGEAPKDDVAISTPRQREFLVGGLLGVAGALVGLGVGVGLLARLPKPTEAERVAAARAHILIAGGLVGLVLMLAGAVFFGIWFGSLVRWLDERKASEAAWVLGPLLVFLLGAGIAFVSAQPARADERHNPTLRRTVYGANLALTTLLLLLALLAGNVLAALKLPAKLDTTESGFYTLSDATKSYLAQLPQTVTAYTNLVDGEDRALADGRRLLDAAQAANPQKFQVRPLSLTLNRTEIESLKSRYPQADLKRELGVLLVPSGDDKRSAFLRVDDMITQEPDPSGGRRGSRTVFKGESILAKELLGLADSGGRRVVYFTQGSGELSVTPPAPDVPRDAARSADLLKAALEQGAAEVRPLSIQPNSEKVPDDAAVVVVADPSSPVPERTATAIQNYLDTAGPDGKKGKLIVLVGSHADRNNQPTPTGMEKVLESLGIRLTPGFVYADPEDGRLGVDELAARPLAARGPLASVPARTLIFPQPRFLGMVAEAAVRPEPLMASVGRLTWIEATRVDPAQAFEALRGLDPEGVRRRQLTDSPRLLAAGVADGESARAVVFGSGRAFSDEAARTFYQDQSAPAEVFGAAVNALRDRPDVANIATKTYGTFPALTGLDRTRAIWLPTGVVVFGILAVGFGVWAFRRT